MKAKLVKLVCGLALLGVVGSTNAQSAFNLYTFQASLKNLTDTSAIVSSGSNGRLFLTDDSMTTMTADIGFTPGLPNNGSNGGALVGDFGGGTYTHGTGTDIVLVGVGWGGNSYWGTFTVSLQLAGGSFTPGLTYSDANVISPNITDTFSAVNVLSPTLDIMTVHSNYSYLPLDISSFDTGGLGVTGIKLDNLIYPHPDITYIGVTDSASAEAVPEPGSFALLGIGAASLALLRRKAARK